MDASTSWKSNPTTAQHLFVRFLETTRCSTTTASPQATLTIVFSIRPTLLYLMVLIRTLRLHRHCGHSSTVTAPCCSFRVLTGTRNHTGIYWVCQLRCGIRRLCRNWTLRTSTTHSSKMASRSGRHPSQCHARYDCSNGATTGPPSSGSETARLSFPHSSRGEGFLSLQVR